MSYIIIASLIATLSVFVLPEKLKFSGLIILSAWITVVTGYSSVYVLVRHDIVKFNFEFEGIVSFSMVIDSLSALFIILINIVSLIGILYSREYLKKYRQQKSLIHFSLHYFALIWLQISMVFLCMFRDGFSFLIAWELMGIASFILILFDGGERHILKTAINYFIQMHIALLCLITAFLMLEHKTGSMSFNALHGYFFNYSNWPLFLLFFAGFGIKAGFFPLHTWLPEAHPAAPSHVSGIMSGIMIKMGIYGILRVVFNLQGDLLSIGIAITILSALTGLYGVMQSVVQWDIKKALAFSSIENIGIIGIAIGTGIIGIYLKNDGLYIISFIAVLLHTINHSIFKPLLFYSAGSVYLATHTRNMDQLGGLARYMPQTSKLFLIGIIALCGLPPLNGFFTEFILFNGLFTGLQQPEPGYKVLFLFILICLVLIGGIAIFSFSKVFGVTFLGNERTKNVMRAKEVTNGLLFPKKLLVVMLVLLAFFTFLLIEPLTYIITSQGSFSGNLNASDHLINLMQKVSMVFFVLIFFVVIVWKIKKAVQKNKVMEQSPTWGCGYTVITPEQQYTSTSFSREFVHIFRPIIRRNAYFKNYAEKEIIPGDRLFYTKVSDRIKTQITDWGGNRILFFFRRIAIFQTGKIQHYILYALLFILGILALTFFNVI